MTAPLSYLALGDSYTIGEGVEAEGRWPMQLAAALRTEGVDLDDPRIVATTGWTTGELAAALDAEEPLGEYALVSLLIGVNNQYRGLSPDDYADEFSRLLERALGYAGGRADRVFALSIPDWGVTPFLAESGRDGAVVAREIDLFNAIAQRICDDRNVAFVDITPVSRARGAEAVMLVDDQLHPSAAMYAEWMRLALPVVRARLHEACRV